MFQSYNKENRSRRYLDDSSSDSSVTTLGEDRNNNNNKNDCDDDDLKSVVLDCPSRQAKWMKDSNETKAMLRKESLKNRRNSHNSVGISSSRTSPLKVIRDKDQSSNGSIHSQQKRKFSTLTGTASTSTSNANTTKKYISSNQNHHNHHRPLNNNEKNTTASHSRTKPLHNTKISVPSPATETLNELTQMNTSPSQNGNDLRFDFSQLSQITSCCDTDGEDETVDNAEGVSMPSTTQTAVMSTKKTNVNTNVNTKAQNYKNDSKSINSSQNMNHQMLNDFSQISHLPQTQQYPKNNECKRQRKDYGSNDDNDDKNGKHNFTSHNDSQCGLKKKNKWSVHVSKKNDINEKIER